MTPEERERQELLLAQLQKDQRDPFTAVLLELDAIRNGLPEDSPEYRHLEIAIKHALICKYRLRDAPPPAPDKLTPVQSEDEVG